jgi:hypothetical protein
MTTGDPEPQIELRRELILTGDLEQLKGVMDVEEALSRDYTSTRPKRICLTLFGPVAHGASIIWLISCGFQPVLSSYRDSIGRRTISRGPAQITVTPDMTLQQIYDQAVDKHLDFGRAFHLGLLRASSLPDGRLRLIFTLEGCDNPFIFWRWVDGLTAELHRLGFSAAAPPGEPPPPADEPGSLESSQSGWLAGQGSRADQVAAGAKPWMKIDDVGWDRRALELWWRGYTVPEIADRLSKRPKTIGNRLSSLRRTYGPDIVPPVGRLRTLNIR